MNRREFYQTRHGRPIYQVCLDAIRDGATKSELVLIFIDAVAKAERVMEHEAGVKND